MGKKSKKAQAGKPKKLTPKDVGKRLNVLAKKVEEELEGADLFAPLPPPDDCAVCFVPLPSANFETVYKSCCGNFVCKACVRENKESIDKQNEEKNAGKKLAFTCPFCREPEPTCFDVEFARLQARSLQNDHSAFTTMGNIYRDGLGKAKDDLKALDCYIRAAELGSPGACTNIGIDYHEGNGVAVDKETAALFERVGALRGSIGARHNLGCSEYHDLGNHEIGIRHWKIAAEAGHEGSLNNLKQIYNGNKHGKEFISKEEMDTAYRSGYDAQLEVKTEEREKHSEKVRATLPFVQL